MSTVTVLCALISLAGEPPPDPEPALLKSRRLIKNGSLVMKTTYNNNQIGTPESTKRSIWFSDDRFRIDVVIEKDGLRDIYGENCEKGGYYVSFCEKDHSKNVMPLYFGSMQRQGPKHGQMHKLDPRVFGLATIPMRSMRAASLEKLMGRTDTKDRRIEWTEYQSKKAVRSKYTLLTARDPVFTMVFLPDSDFHLAEMTEEYAANGATHRTLLTATAKRWNMTWFPKTFQFQKFVDGILVEEEQNVILEAEFNKGVPAGVFTLAGMNLPANIPIRVIGNRDSSLEIWNGKEIVPQKSNADPKKSGDDKPVPSKSHLAFFDLFDRWWVSGALLLIGIIILCRHYIRKPN